ncbi:glycerol-3-phosphate dehydrogenase/oxidase [Flavicella sediminum]|uniref:glycerol-3-phosphate dehydrogenase/oxidase n=1 Tax=Flavicella sediminum TaxID=2585141 RepID=UPI001121F1BF|nr:glycerol-3-phosphate dehydrogenase/oxidase [Flavicella sediminum]
MKNTVENTFWDVLIIGGGATGIGTAIDAASRGYKTLLVEQFDFGSGTSSKSTKLIHGGVRYLQQGNLSLVTEALKERAILKKNAPHIVHDLEFIVPNYDWWEGPFYGIGLKLYDLLARKESFGDSIFLSKEETIAHLPTIEQKDLQGGVLYHDGQFDDTRLLVSMMRTAEKQGATLLNYTQLIALTKTNNTIDGAIIENKQSQIKQTIKAKVIINATGVFSDSIRKKDNSSVTNIIKGSQGIHIVLDQDFLPGDKAIMIPHTKDGRVLFAVPWHGKLLVGTTDTELKNYPIHPIPFEEEIDFLLSHTAQYLVKDPTRKDIKSIFSGIRPLALSGNTSNTSEISREHKIEVSDSGLVSILGGKWTTYRKMAKDVMNVASTLVSLPRVKSKTQNLKLHGYTKTPEQFGTLSIYGTDAALIEELYKEHSSFKEKLHPQYDITVAQVIFAIRFEKAVTIEDVLARRTRLLFLDVAASLKASKLVGQLLVKELNKDQEWLNQQLIAFEKTAKTFTASPL